MPARMGGCWEQRHNPGMHVSTRTASQSNPGGWLTAQAAIENHCSSGPARMPGCWAPSTAASQKSGPSAFLPVAHNLTIQFNCDKVLVRARAHASALLMLRGVREACITRQLRTSWVLHADDCLPGGRWWSLVPARVLQGCW